MDQRDVFAEAVAQLLARPEFAGLAGANAPIILWDPSGERLLWASSAAEPFSSTLTGDLDRASPFAARLRALAGGLAPRESFRLERIRFDPSRLAAPATCACRRILLPSGEEALLTVILGPSPKLALEAGNGSAASRPAKALDDDLPSSSNPNTASEPMAPGSDGVAVEIHAGSPAATEQGALQARDPVAHLRARGKVRFVWQADAEGRFTRVSDLLAGIVGIEQAEIVGRRWDEIVGPDIEDPSGRVAGAFSRRETLSGETVFWRIRSTDFLIPVEFAGAPVFGGEGGVVGYRGFGLFRTGEIVERPRPQAAPDGGASALPAKDQPAETAAGELASETSASDRSESEAAPVPPAETDRATESKSPPLPATLFAALHGQVSGHFGDAETAGAEAPLPAEPSPESETPAEASAPAATPGEARQPAALSRLSLTERSAFREIARALGARFEGDDAPEGAPADETREVEIERPSTVTPLRPAARAEVSTASILQRLPIAVLVHRGDAPLFANLELLHLAGYESVEQLARAGGLSRLFPGRSSAPPAGSPISLATRTGDSLAVELRENRIDWEGAPASLLLIRRTSEAEQRLPAAELELAARAARLSELSAILDTATDGVVILDEGGRILSLNRSAEALFGYEQNEVAGDTFLVLLAPESHALARDYLEGLRTNGVASLLNDGREVTGRVRQGGSIPLFMTIGRVSDEPERKFCAVLRDITAFKKAEGELLAAKRAADEGSTQKSDFLAKVSYEIRTPLNAMIGFAEVMLEERLGPVGSERYKDYLRDIHASGRQVVKLVDDLLDLARIEAGRMELAFTAVNLNERVADCVRQAQALAARRRIVIRTSFAPKLPPVVADERSMRQIVENIVSNAIKFTEAGGQVIVSTAIADQGEAAIRVRDTGTGMSEDEIRAALAPFGQRSALREGGTGLGLPLTKALVEANRGALHITSSPGEGTLVEVVFPPTRVLAE